MVSANLPALLAEELFSEVVALGAVDVIELPVQVNGKLKGLVSSKKDDGERLIFEKAKSLGAVGS